MPFGFAAGYWPDYYGYGYDDCYQTVRVASAYGPVWRTVNVCEY
ncbi:MAG TPA: hypothetical protein VN004_10075 [Pseudorhodoplanes sp.]|nr:hypothetical protein [Pseudorhodoplanes sp.]